MIKLDIKCQSDDAFRKLKEWNAVNPTSEKPKIGRGTFMKEQKWIKGCICIDKCLRLAC